MYSAGLFPVNVAGAVTVFVLFHHGVTELFHDRNVQTTVFTNQWWHFFPNDEAVVTDNENGPVFIKEVQETTEVIVGLTIYVYDAILIFFFVGVLPWFEGFTQVPKLVPCAVNVVQVAEHYFIATGFCQVVQAVCLPFAVVIPRWNEYVTNEVCFFPTDERYRRNRTTFFTISW